MSDFKSRLVKFARERYGYGQNKFEEYCGIPRGTINSIKPGRGITTGTLTKILVKCPELNVQWLLLGEADGGSMLLNESREDVADEPVGLPLIPFEAVAGHGSHVYEDEKVDAYYNVSEFRDCDFIIRVKGDSMAPHFTGGDLLACKRVADAFFFQWNRCYVVYTRSQGCMVKRIHPSEKDGWIKCVSDNPDYAPFDVPLDDIVSVALVNGSISLE